MKDEWGVYTAPDKAHPLDITRRRKNHRGGTELGLGRKELDPNFVDKFRVPGSTHGRRRG